MFIVVILLDVCDLRDVASLFLESAAAVTPSLLEAVAANPAAVVGHSMRRNVFIVSSSVPLPYLDSPLPHAAVIRRRGASSTRYRLS
jgi:hypothetical protein